MTTTRKPILCLDFDGVVHAYRRGWQDGAVYDDVVPGFFEWAARARDLFELMVYSSRSGTVSGRDAMRSWLSGQLITWKRVHIVSIELPPYLDDFVFAREKPPAFLSIDDRGLQFRGDWSAWWLAPEQLAKFKPWTSGEQAACPAAVRSVATLPDSWRPIVTAPRKIWVEVTGPSGMRSPPNFLALARYDSDHRPLEPWRDVQGDALSDCGWVPTHWRPSRELPSADDAPATHHPDDVPLDAKNKHPDLPLLELLPGEDVPKEFTAYRHGERILLFDPATSRYTSIPMSSRHALSVAVDHLRFIVKYGA